MFERLPFTFCRSRTTQHLYFIHCATVNIRKMKKDRFYILAALFLGATLTLTSCGGEPASDDLQPEATQGDYLGNDDLDTSTDTTMTDTIETVQ